MKVLSVSIVSIQLYFLLAALFCAPEQSSALQWPGQYMKALKNYLVVMVRDGAINSSTMVSTFNECMTNIRTRFEEAKANGELEGLDENEKSTYYYKLVIDEVKRLREAIQPQNHSAELLDEVKQSKQGSRAAARFSSYHSDFGMDMDMDLDSDESEDEELKAIELKEDDIELLDMEQDMELEDAEELELLNQLNQLEEVAKKEADMGWSMSQEDRDKLRLRTKLVVHDLLHNELRQLAMAVLSSYMSGGGAVLPVAASLAGGIKFKLVEYFMNTVTDVLSIIMGKRIEVTTGPSTGLTQEPAPESVSS